MENSNINTKALLGRFFHHLNLRDDEDIFALGFINSLFLAQLILFVEREFGITIENEDFGIENFRTINAIAQLIEGKTAAQVPCQA